MISAREAIERLREGNRRFVSDDPSGVTNVSQEELAELAAGQHPFAAIVGCSDSRVPVELVFDQGMGDLFVIRVAGNIISSSQIGSVEFAVMEFGTPLVVVMGHASCGAVAVTVDEIMNTKPVTVHADTSTVDAIRLMREKRLACLPVTRDNKLVGIITEHDLIVVASHLLETYLVQDT